jgi:hypothetical protein
VWLAFDFGLPSPPFLPAHAHADALSFQLWVDGRAIVVDPGAFTYEPGVERTWFRSTRAHSTVEVAGRSQFETWGAFRAGPLPQPVLVAAEPLEAEVTLGEVVVRRRLHLRPDELVVEDELDGRGSVAVSSNLPLGTTVAVAETGGLGAAPAVGWLSERMLERAAITGYRAEGVVRLPASLGWRIGLRSAT